MQTPEFVIEYQEREQFFRFHDRTERFACIVTHPRAGKTVACIHDLQLGATRSQKIPPRFAYLSPFLKQSKPVARVYLPPAIAPLPPLRPNPPHPQLPAHYPTRRP